MSAPAWQGIVAAVAASILMAGCTGFDGPSPPPEHRAPTREIEVPTQPHGTEDVPVVMAPAKAVSRDLVVDVDVAERWVRPGDAIAAQARVPGAARLTWWFVNRNPEVPDDKRAGDHLVIGPIPVNESAVVDFSRPGRYEIAAEHLAPPLMNITVLSDRDNPGGDAVVVDVVTVGGRLRLLPDEIHVRPGASVEFRNRGAGSVGLLGNARMDHAGEGSNLTLPAPRELGDYDLVIVAQDGWGRYGSASARIIVDKRKPDENTTWGPFRGEFMTGSLPAGGDAPLLHAVNARYALTEVTVQVNATSIVGSGAVVVEWLDPEGRVLAKSEPMM